MQVRILGSGTIAGQTGRNCAGYLIDEQILLDCGPGIWSALYSAERPGRQINHIVLSHFHVDHIADLTPFLWARWVLEVERQNVLSVYGPVGLKNWFKRLTAVHKDWTEDLAISLHEFKGEGFHPLTTPTGLYNITALPVDHTEHSICMRISDTHGKSLFYSGDSGWHENLIKLSSSCDVAIMDSANPSKKRTKDHLTPVLAAKIAGLSGVKRLILTHLYPEVWDSSPAQEAARSFTGEILIAQDKLVVFF